MVTPSLVLQPLRVEQTKIARVAERQRWPNQALT